jgi:hypothetical protein
MGRIAKFLKEKSDFTIEEVGGAQYDEELRRVWRNRRSVKLNPSNASLFRYLFVEYRKIRAFGNITHVLFPRLIPSGMRLSGDVGATFAKHLQPWAVELLRALSYILRSGWPFLSKKEYNLLVMLNKLCEKISSTDFALLDGGDRNLVDKLRALECHFLVIHYRPEYPEIIVSALEKIAKIDLSTRKEDLRGAIPIVKRILNKGDDLPSLYNFLLGLNMLKYRRYFELQDLIDRGAGEMVSSDTFECDKQTQEEIDFFIEDCKKELVSLHKKKLEILHAKTYVPHNEMGQVDFKILEFFYVSNDAPDRYDFTKDQENLFLLATRFLRIFLSSFENILNGKIQISGVGYVELFARNFFQIEFTKLRSYTDKLETAAYGFQAQTSYSHYLLVKSGRRAVSESESDAFGILQEALRLLVGLGKKLDRILHSRIPAVEGGEGRAPIEAGALKERAFVLPHENGIIKFKTKLGGRRVGEALAFVVSICYLAGVFFRAEEVYNLIGDEVKVCDAVRSKLEVLERVAKPKEYQELRERYV